MTVQFTSPASAGKIEGLLDIDEDDLTVEFEKVRFIAKNKVLRLKLPLDDIDYIRYSAQPFRSKLEVRALFLETLQDIPWAKSLTADFIIPRAERDRARELAERFDEFIHEDVEDDNVS